MRTHLLFDTALHGLAGLMQLQARFPQNVSLFKGTPDQALMDAAPFLITVSDYGPMQLLDAPLHNTVPDLYVLAKEDGEALRPHLQQFIYRNAGGRQQYFRFWDARVMSRQLEQWQPFQLTQFFGPVSAFVTVGQNDSWSYSLENGRLLKAKIQNQLSHG